MVSLALEDAFDAIADRYAEQYPSPHTSLRWFGDQFAAFLTESADANAPALSAMALFERALLDAFDAPGAPQLESSSFEAFAQSGRIANSLRLHPSVRLLSPGWNVVHQWHCAKNAKPLSAWQSEDGHWALWRDRDRRTSFRSVSPVELSLLQATQRGESIPAMCEALSTQIPPQNVPRVVASTLKAWLSDGLVCAIE